MSAAWYTDALRSIASGIARLADRLDAPSHDADYLDRLRPEQLPPEERVFDLRHRLSRYY